MITDRSRAAAKTIGMLLARSYPSYTLVVKLLAVARASPVRSEPRLSSILSYTVTPTIPTTATIRMTTIEVTIALLACPLFPNTLVYHPHKCIFWNPRR